MNTALILSGGVGSRLGGDMPKQYIEVGGRILLSYCLERLSRHPLVDAVQIVAQEEWQGTIRSCLKRYHINKKLGRETDKDVIILCSDCSSKFYK